jgi:uncharacterized membrane protein (UPF0127 family)
MVGIMQEEVGAGKFRGRAGPTKSRRSRGWSLLAIVMFVLGMSLLGTALLVRAEPNVELLSIETATGTHEFSVEVARSAPAQARGLMYRKWMPFDHGMLFVLSGEQSIRMWMKNTYLPLDMIFVAGCGQVVDIHEDAIPFSEGVIASESPAYAVLEVNAGTAAKIGLRRGDFVRHPAFAGH